MTQLMYCNVVVKDRAREVKGSAEELLHTEGPEYFEGGSLLRTALTDGAEQTRQTKHLDQGAERSVGENTP